MNTFDAVRKIFDNQKGSCGLLLKILAFQKMVHPTIHHRTIGGAYFETDTQLEFLTSRLKKIETKKIFIFINA